MPKNQTDTDNINILNPSQSSNANTVIKKKFDASVERILEFVINKIYKDSDIFLRELISNASDACDKERYARLLISDLDTNIDHEPLKVQVLIDKANKTIEIHDNGVGMDALELSENLGTIANSGTQKFAEMLTHSEKHSVQMIGQFGIGFYSGFMVADEVTVYSTKRQRDLPPKTYIWKSNGMKDYEISESDKAFSYGTIVKLHLKSNKLEYLESYKLRHIISLYSDHIAFPIELIEKEKNIPEVVNVGQALWTKNQSQISEEEYNEFYHHIAHSYDDPWMRFHNKLEGNIEYTSLLFIPTNKPFDLFHPDRKTRVKLYIKRVFITDELVELVPNYMRFLRGVVDSEDLPLNISRETLQHNNTIQSIRQSIIKKVISGLQTKSIEQPEEYDKFWLTFGEVIKEGLCAQNASEKEDLIEICKFYSTKSGKKNTSLQDYISRMLSNQNDIYYMVGNNIEDMMNNPQLEGFITRDIEVILLQDHVDNYWVNVITEYKGKELKSVARSGINLDNDIKSTDTIVQSISNTTKNEDWKKLTDYVQFLLKDKVKEVRISENLVESPACLTIPEGSMDVRMENILIEQKQLKNRATKILEINPHHKLFIKVLNMIENGELDDESSLDNNDKIITSNDDSNNMQKTQVINGVAIDQMHIHNHVNNHVNNKDIIHSSKLVEVNQKKSNKIKSNEIKNIIYIIFDMAKMNAGEILEDKSKFNKMFNDFLINTIDI